MHGTMMKRMPIENGQLLSGFGDVQGMLGMCIHLWLVAKMQRPLEN